MNRIVEVKLTLADGKDSMGRGPDGDALGWFVDVKKEFAPEHGGGSQTFREYGGKNLHRALNVARGMVTASPHTAWGANIDPNTGAIAAEDGQRGGNDGK